MYKGTVGIPTLAMVDDIAKISVCGTPAVVDNAYMFKYIHAPGLRTEIHTDQGCLSFTFALNSNSEYKGGGTFVEGLTKVYHTGQYSCLF